MKRIFTLLLCCLMMLGTTASNRSVSKMQELAAQKLASLGTPAVKTRSVSVNADRVMKRSDLSVFTDGEHFVVISHDNRFPAVLAYGMGDFKTDELNSSVRWWLEATERGLAEAKRTARSFQRATTYESVAEILTTKWNQSAPYNNYAPSLKLYNGQKAPAGCVAIAMAQVMNHFQYPASAQFEGYYYQEGYTDEPYQGNVNSTYSWPYLDYYNYYYSEGSSKQTKVSTSPRQGNLVATLCRDCAYAVNMTYTIDGSGAQTYDLAQNIIDHFAYSEVGCHLYNRDAYTTDEWHAMIYEELQRGYPLLYSGFSSEGSGGHAFVVDGIDTEGLVHVNWGWAGIYNGYFDMDMMNYTQDENFAAGQDVTVIRPVALEGEVYGSLLMMDSPFSLEYDKDTKVLTITWGGISNECGKKIDGTIGFVFEHLTQPDSSDIISLMDEEDEDHILPAGWGYRAYSYPVEEANILAPGDYHVYIASKDKHETDFQMARLSGGGFYYIEISVDKNGDITVGKSVTYMGDTAIHGVSLSDAERQHKGVYNLQGHSLGNNPQNLPKGIYIIDGKKVVK